MRATFQLPARPYRHVLLLSGLAVMAVLQFSAPPGRAYVTALPPTFGKLCDVSTHVVVIRLEKIEKTEEATVLTYRKVRDLKGKWPSETFRQKMFPSLWKVGLGKAQGTRPPIGDALLKRIKVGMETVQLAREKSGWSHTYLDGMWYISTTDDKKFAERPDWLVSADLPLMLTVFSGKRDQLIPAATQVLAGKEAVVPCLEPSSQEKLRARQSKLRYLRVSLKRLDYNPKRDRAISPSSSRADIGRRRSRL
jgi:hypothetical protein